MGWRMIFTSSSYFIVLAISHLKIYFSTKIVQRFACCMFVCSVDNNVLFVVLNKSADLLLFIFRKPYISFRSVFLLLSWLFFVSAQISSSAWMLLLLLLRLLVVSIMINPLVSIHIFNVSICSFISSTTF